MEEEELWEALDLDDSDISSSSSSFSLLRRCSLQLPQPPPPPPSQPPPRQQPPSASRRPIPGPAGAIQAAMHRNTRLTSPRNAEASEVSTQEYIRRVEEDDGREFSRNPWILALDVLRQDGGGDATPLRTVKQCGGAQRIDKVVALVKSCKLNGLGDMMVTLKDPTDTLDASVHRKVLSTGECGKLIAVGSVLILQKVVAFYSSSASCYLNITRHNVIKIVSADCAVQSFAAADAHPSLDLEIRERHEHFGDVQPGYIGKGKTVADECFGDAEPGYISKGKTVAEEPFRDAEPGYISKGKAIAEEPIGTYNSSQTINLSSSRHIETAANNISKEPVHINSVDSGQKSLSWLSKFRNNSQRSAQTQPDPGTGEGFRNQNNLDKAEQQARDFSSAPNVTEYRDIQHAWLANGSKRGSLPSDNNLDTSGANEVRRQRHHPDINSSYMSENVTNQEIHRPTDVQKRRQPLETVSNIGMDSNQDEEADVAKKQKVALISRTAVQEWTDEQLGILDMDED